MGSMRHVAAAVLVGGLAIAGWEYAQAKSTNLTAQDYTEITELYARLYQGGDLRELDLWLSNFVDDAVYGFPNGDSVTGKPALSEWRKKSWAGQTGDSRSATHRREPTSSGRVPTGARPPRRNGSSRARRRRSMPCSWCVQA